MGTNLIESYWKFSKSHPAQKVELQVILDAIEAKVPLLLQIFGNDCDDVSATVLDFVRDYLHVRFTMQQHYLCFKYRACVIFYTNLCVCIESLLVKKIMS